MWILFLMLLIFFELVADIAAKNWSLSGGKGWMYALLFYLIANSFWLIALKKGSGLARGAVIFSIVTVVVALILGLLVYKEPVNKNQLIGLILGIISIVLLSS